MANVSFVGLSTVVLFDSVTCGQSAIAESYDDDMLQQSESLDSDEVRNEDGSAPLSGMAIGLQRAYLTLKAQPYVISVGKPHL